MENKTHFGFRDVPESAKAGLVGDVFDSVASRYDLMNDLMSFGIHRLWKDYAVTVSAVRAGERVLDVAGGTGDVAARLARRVGREGSVVIADINASMLAIGRGRLADRGFAGNIEFVQADAEDLPFPDNRFDCVTIAFGLRNVTHIDRALASMCRVLRPGGRLLVLEFSQPVAPGLERLYDAYSFTVLPILGQFITGDRDSYLYLVESIRKHPPQARLKAMMEEAGLARVEYFNLTGGVVALHRGYKP